MMKHTMSLVLLWSVAVSASPQGIEIIGGAGQSNMSGSAPLNHSLPQTPDILRWSGTYQMWLTATEGMNVGGPGYVGAKSLLFSAGHELLTCVDSRGRQLYPPVGFVSCAVSGSPLDSWLPGQPNYEVFIGAMKDAMEASPRGSRFAGIFWLQGEHEAAIGGVAVEEYYGKAWEMFLCMRDDLGDQSIPIVIGEIGDWRGGEPDRMNAVLRSLASTLPYAAYAESIGLTSHDGNHHYDSESLDVMGQRFAQAFRRVDRPKEPLAVRVAQRLR